MQYIRVDANEHIGIGHLMRMLSVAEALRTHNEAVTFITADDNSAELIKKHGFANICMNTQWNELESEIDVIERIIKTNQISVLIIDTYYVTPKYLLRIGKLVKMVYFDDIDKFMYPVDLLINYNIYAQDMDYEGRYGNAGLKTKFALGCGYAPLRAEFCGSSRRTYTSGRILVSSGGTDNYNLAGRFLEAVSKQNWFDSYAFDVIIGNFNVHAAQLAQQWGDAENISLLQNIDDVAYYMRNCDMAISAAGVTMYELCACGTPAVIYTLADNQIRAAEKFAEKHLAKYAGDIRDNTELKISNIVKNVEALLYNKETLVTVGENMRQIVDGKGCERIARLILGV